MGVFGSPVGGEGRGKREERREKREEGRGKRKERRGKREEGREKREEVWGGATALKKTFSSRSNGADFPHLIIYETSPN